MSKIPFILNKMCAASYRHPEVGTIEPLTAVEVDESIATKLKGIHGLFIFDKVDFVKTELTQQILTYEDFLLQSGGDMKEAAKLWEEYKITKGLS